MSGKVDYTATLNFLHSPKSAGIKYGIDRMKSIVNALGHPEKTFPIIHVAGTNGKGSTSAMLEAIYRANNYTTGLYTSPHLIHLGELIQVNRHPLTEDDIIGYTERLKPVAAALCNEEPDNYPSFFELMTAMAFLHFAKTNVDIAIVETGVGGRLDATNVVDPELSIITSISFDHTDLLGETLEKITMEKAGIIKPNKPVLFSRLPDISETLIKQVAQKKNSTVYSIREQFPDETTLPETNLTGSCQRWNAAIAVCAVEILKKQFTIDPKKNYSALHTINWPGRWQTIQLADKTLILDATHNAEGAEILDENLNHLVQQTKRKPIIIAGTTGEARARSLMHVVGRYARELHLLAPKQPNATPTKFLESCLPANHSKLVFHQTIQTLFPRRNVCTAGKPNDTIVITGSIYLIGEVLEQLTEQPYRI